MGASLLALAQFLLYLKGDYAELARHTIYSSFSG